MAVLAAYLLRNTPELCSRLAAASGVMATGFGTPPVMTQELADSVSSYTRCLVHNVSVLFGLCSVCVGNASLLCCSTWFTVLNFAEVQLQQRAPSMAVFSTAPLTVKTPTQPVPASHRHGKPTAIKASMLCVWLILYCCTTLIISGAVQCCKLVLSAGCRSSYLHFCCASWCHASWSTVWFSPCYND